MDYGNKSSHFNNFFCASVILSITVFGSGFYFQLRNGIKQIM
jgi:hypothetical protein